MIRHERSGVPSLIAAALLGTAIAIVSCGQSQAPPLAGFGGGGGYVPPAPSAPAPPVVVPGQLSCTLGPDGGFATDSEAGVCGCEELAMLGSLPNIHFVLDRSGSMNDNNKWSTIIATVAQIVTNIGPRANFGAAVFPNPNGGDCTPGVEVMSLRPGDSPAGTPGPVARLLVSAAGATASGGTPTAATLLELLPKLAAAKGKTFVILATDGGPNCNAALSCTSTQCCPNIEGQAGCTDAAVNCCDPSIGGGGNCLDGTATAIAVGQLESAGIPVYVIGVPGSEPYADVLNQMAQAGGTARATPPYYYAVTSTDQGAFLSTLSQVAASITASCVFSLGAPPQDPTLVNVYLNNSVLAQSGPDGWTLTGSTVTILGASCASIMSGNVLDVRIVAGCPTVVQ